MKTILVTLAAILGFAILVAPSPVYAQSSPVASRTTPGFSPSTAGALDDILVGFEKQTSRWSDSIEVAATHFFLDLAVISLVWMCMQLLFSTPDWGQFTKELMKFIFVTGLFYMLLRDGPSIATTIMQGFARLGGDAVGAAVPVGHAFGASALIAAAGDIWTTAFSILANFNILTDPLGIFAMMLIVCVISSFICLLMAIEVMLAWIQAYAVMYGGVFFLGFGGGPWFRDIAVGYWKTIVSKGAFLFGVILSVGLFLQFATSTLLHIEHAAAKAAAGGFFSAASAAEQPILEGLLLKFLVQAVLCFLVLTRLPKMLAQLPYGGGSYQGHGVHGGAGVAAAAAVGAATGGAAGALSGAAKGLRGTVAGLGGGGGGGNSGGGGGDSGGGGGGGFKPAGSGGGNGPGPMVSDEQIAAASKTPAKSNGGAQSGHTLMGQIGRR